MQSFELNNKQYVFVEEDKIQIKDSVDNDDKNLKKDLHKNDVVETNSAWYNFFY